MITRGFAERFAQEWISAWNSHDLDQILSHYSDDFTMSSPRIAALTEQSSGILCGKTAWWPTTGVVRWRVRRICISP